MTSATAQLDLNVPLAYIEATIPVGMTVQQYRRSRPRRPTRWERMKRIRGGSAPGLR